MTGKFRGAGHWNCNLNLQLTQNVPVIFHNLIGYASHLIFGEFDIFDAKISVISNGLGKYMAFVLNKNLLFIDSIPFMNSSLDKLVKNLSDEDFERFNEEKLPARKYFFISTKKGKIVDDGKISDGHISFKDYLTCEKTWNKFERKNMGGYHDHYLKKKFFCL